MNKETRYAIIGAVAVLIVVVLVLMASSGGSDANDSRRTSDFLDSFEETGDSPLEATDSPAEAEAALGIALPTGSSVATVIDGASQTSVTGLTALSVNDARVWLDAEIVAIGGVQSRPWNLLPGEGSSKQSATYTVDGQPWSVNLQETSQGTQFDISRQK